MRCNVVFNCGGPEWFVVGCQVTWPISGSLLFDAALSLILLGSTLRNRNAMFEMVAGFMLRTSVAKNFANRKKMGRFILCWWGEPYLYQCQNIHSTIIFTTWARYYTQQCTHAAGIPNTSQIEQTKLGAEPYLRLGTSVVRSVISLRSCVLHLTIINRAATQTNCIQLTFHRLTPEHCFFFTELSTVGFWPKNDILESRYLVSLCHHLISCSEQVSYPAPWRRFPQPCACNYFSLKNSANWHETLFEWNFLSKFCTNYSTRLSNEL